MSPRRKRPLTGSAGLDAVFRPRAVAVVGASRRRHQIGHEVVHNLVEGGFEGPVYPVNPKGDVVHSIPSHPSVSCIKGPVDLAVIVVPVHLVMDVIRDCAKKRVGAVVVITAGFHEIGGTGSQRQEELVSFCREHGIRVVGPNCMGVLNTEPGVSMNASFSAALPPVGGAAFVSQSGALGEAILADAREIGLGVRMFASIGNRADVEPADLIEYWGEDDGVEQILLYLESFGNPARFQEVARRVSRKKPIMVVKSGRTARGAKAASSHTGSLAGAEAAVDSLLEQCGVLRVASMKQLFLQAAAVQACGLPKSRRVAIVTNAGGPGILATDSCIGHGLLLPDLTAATTRKLKSFLPAEASASNPVDLIASADAERYDKTLQAVLADRGVDAVLAIFVSPVMIDANAVARTFVKHAQRTKKPFVASVLGKQQGAEALELLRDAGVVNYRFPEEAAISLAGLARLAELRDRPKGARPDFRVKKSSARRVIENAIAKKRYILKGVELGELLHAYGIPLVPTRIVGKPVAAVEAAEEFGYPVVLKVESSRIEHKTDFGGVILDLRSADDVLAAYRNLEKLFKRKDPKMRVLVQKMASGGVEVLMGAANDPVFGKMMVFGLGGIHVEVLKDVVFRLHPITAEDAKQMVQGIRARALLEGVRGSEPVDTDFVEEVLLRLNRMLLDNPEIAEMDLNPFLAAPSKGDSFVLDMRVRLG